MYKYEITNAALGDGLIIVHFVILTPKDEPLLYTQAALPAAVTKEEAIAAVEMLVKEYAASQKVIKKHDLAALVGHKGEI